MAIAVILIRFSHDFTHAWIMRGPLRWNHRLFIWTFRARYFLSAIARKKKVKIKFSVDMIAFDRTLQKSRSFPYKSDFWSKKRWNYQFGRSRSVITCRKWSLITILRFQWQIYNMLMFCSKTVKFQVHLNWAVLKKYLRKTYFKWHSALYVSESVWKGWEVLQTSNGRYICWCIREKPI